MSRPSSRTSCARGRSTSHGRPTARHHPRSLDPAAALLEVAIGEWMDLEEVYVPYHVQEQAADLVRRLAGAG